MGVEERTIELILISATDLQKVKKFGQEQRCFAVAYIYPSQKKESPVDNYGGVNPTWNSNLKLTCDDALLQQQGPVITVEIFSHGSLFHSSKNKLVGTVTIPLKEIVTNDGQITAYPVTSGTGKAQGTLNLSFKLGKTRTLGEYEDPAAPRMSHYSSDPSSSI